MNLGGCTLRGCTERNGEEMLFKKDAGARLLELDLLEALFFFVLTWFAIYGLIGVGLGNLGVFRAKPVLIISGLAALLISLKFIGIKTIMERSGLSVWLALPIMAGLFFPPFEYVFGGRDPGVYIAVGAGLARKGNLQFYDAQIASLSPEDQEFYYRLRGVEGNKDFGDSYCKNRQYPGLFATNLENGEITPQFYPLYPVLLAAGYSLGGLIGELAMTPFLAIFALIAVYLFTRHLFSEKVALVTLLLLLVSYPILWYSRYPNSEMVAMLFLLGGSWLLHLAFQKSSPGLIFLTTLIFMAAALTRIDNLLLLIPFILVSLGGFSYQERKPLLLFTVLGILGLSIGIFQGWFFSRPYISQVVLKEGAISLCFAFSLLILPFLLVTLAPLSRFQRLFQRYQEVLLNFFALGLFVFIFNLQVIGFLVPSVSDWANLVKLEWYLTPPVVLIGIWGTWRVLVRQWSLPAVRFLFSYTLFVSIFYLWRARVSLDHPWWVRRFLPVVIPGLILGFSWMINEWFKKKNQFWQVFILSLVWLIYLRMSFSIIRFNLFSGGVSFVKEAARLIPQDVVTVAKDDWGMLATPLYYLFDRRVITLNPDQPPEIQFKSISRAQSTFPEKGVWFYSFGSSDQAAPPFPSFLLTAERIFLFKNFGLFHSLPLVSGGEEVISLQIYQPSDIKNLRRRV